jgi:aspartokinase-like uncharacterized kinase
MAERAAPVVVVKVGGSLYDVPDLRNRLRGFLQSLEGCCVLLVPGGGATADVVRDWDRRHSLGEESAHWLALRALTLNAYWLLEMLPEARVVGMAEAAGVYIIDAFAFAAGDEGRPGALPHIWDATSDAVAARVAVVARADRLILLKSVAIADGIDWQAAAELGWVDPVFPNILKQATWPMRVHALALRPESP